VEKVILLAKLKEEKNICSSTEPRKNEVEEL